MTRKQSILTAACVAFAIGAGASAGAADGFTDPCSWDVFNAGYHGVGDNPKGFAGAVFDGRYVYFVPNNDGSYNGEVLRYDTTGGFRDVAAWAAYSPKANGVGDDPSGFDGGLFDGRYVYFIPYQNSTGSHGEFMRYDTAAPFDDAASWSTFDPSKNGVGLDPVGFVGGAFDGRYLYFAPFLNSTGHHGEAMRYDTAAPFDDAASWVTYDAHAHGVGEEFGYTGAVYDGRYVYFVANCSGVNSPHGEFRRYDTAGEFTDVASWTAYDPGDNGVGDGPDGFVGGAFDGRYIYFAPGWDLPNYHGQTLRYDTAADFSSASSWTAYDPGAAGLGDDPDGYSGAIYDGRYVYYVPCHNGSQCHSEVLRYDTAGDYTNLASWAVFNARTEGLTNVGGYSWGVFDGRHVYFCPNRWGVPPFYGQVLRVDTRTFSGDINHDSVVDISDLATLLANYNMTAGADCEDGDLDGDGQVNLGDLAALLAVYGDAYE